MLANNRFRSTALSALALFAMVACGGKDAQPAMQEPAREIQLAPTPVAQPQLNDAPEKTAAPKKTAAAPKPAPAPAPLHVQVSPVTPQPAAAPAAAPAPAGPAPVLYGIVNSGTAFAVSPFVKICTNTHRVGDRFTATLSQPVNGSAGVSIPAGSVVTMRVIESARSQNTKDSIRLAFDVLSVRVGNESYTVDGKVQTAPFEKVRAQSTATQAEKVGAGAAIGAIIGQVLGKNTKSTVIGGAVGAAAGAATAMATADYDGCIPASSPMTVTLNQPIRIKAGT